MKDLEVRTYLKDREAIPFSAKACFALLLRNPKDAADR
jgi:hypothetical protein